MSRLLTLAVVGLLFAATAQAAIIVVNQGGGGDAATIQGGVDLANANDEVRVEAGTYFENVTMKSGVRLVSADGPGATVIDGHGDSCVQFIRCGAGSAVIGFTLTHGGGDIGGGVYVYDESDVEIGGCIIRDNATTYEGAGVQIQRYAYAHIHDSQFLDNRSYHACAIVVIVGSRALVERNLFRGNVSEFLSAGIGINTASVQIRDNWFIANRSEHGATIHVVKTVSFATVVGNSFVFNEGSSDGGSGVYAYDGGNMTAEHNIFAFNRGTAAIYNRNGVLDLACNDIWENDVDYQGIANPVGANGNIGLDPLICDPLTDDVALSAYSPCLSAVCGVIGANATPACSDAVPVEQQSWGGVKNAYR